MGYFDRWPLAKAWEEDKHPRHPAGAPQGQGGEFAPSTNGGTITSGKEGPMLKWVKEKSAYGRITYTSDNGLYRISRTAYAPTIGYAHDKGAQWWGLDIRDEKLGVAPDYWVQGQSFTSFERAKRSAEERFRRREA